MYFEIFFSLAKRRDIYWLFFLLNVDNGTLSFFYMLKKPQQKITKSIVNKI